MSPFYLNGTIGIEMSPDRTNCRKTNRGFDECELIAAAQGGNTQAFEALLKPHSKRILRALRAITRNHEDAEDALQTAILKAFSHINNFDGRSKFSTWLTRIAINSALVIVRKNNSIFSSRIESYEDGGRGGIETFADQALNPEAEYLQHEREVLLHRAFHALAPPIRQALALQRFHGLSLKETAARMGLSVSAVKSRLLRARLELRRSLAEMHS